MFHPLDRQFYLTLPSNASASSYPNNKLSSFTVKLHTPLELEGQVGDWEVGLCECIYPNSIGNVARLGDSWWRYRIRAPANNTSAVGDWLQCSIPRGRYNNADELVEAMNKSLRESNKDDVHPHTNNNFTTPITFSLHPSAKNRISVSNNVPPSTVDFYFSPRLSNLLGFTPTEIMFSVLGQFTVIYAPQKMNLNAGGVSMMYIYSNICQAQVVGDAMVPLLRIIPLSSIPARPGTGADGAGKLLSCAEFPQPHYVPIRQRHIDTVRIDINTDSGEPIPLMVSDIDAKVIVKLHIRSTRRGNHY